MGEFYRQKGLFNDDIFKLNGQPCLRFADFLVFNSGQYVQAKIFIENKKHIKIVNSLDNSNLPRDIVFRCLNLFVSYYEGSMNLNLQLDDFKYVIENFNSFNDCIDYKDIKIDLCENIPLSTYYKFSMNGVSLKELFLIKQNISSNLEVFVDKTEPTLSAFGYSVKVNINEDTEKNTVIFGVCISSKEELESIKIHIADKASNHLKTSNVTMHIFQSNALWALQVLEYVTNKKNDNPIQFADLTNKNKKRFFIVFPIFNLEITKAFSFGGVSYDTNSGLDPKVEPQFLSMINKLKPSAFAQISVTASSIREASDNAYNILHKSFNLLLILLRDDSIKLLYNFTSKFRNWDSNIIKVIPSIGEYFYFEDCIANLKVILPMDIECQKENFIIKETLVDIIDNENFVENFFYTKDSEIKKSILNAIFWLNQSYALNDIDYRIIALYNAIEFIVNKETGISIIAEFEAYAEWKLFKEKIDSAIQEVKDPTFRERLKGLYVDRNENDKGGVFNKLEVMMQRLNFQVTKTDWVLLKKLRDNRHYIIHNKKNKNQIKNEELNQLYYLVAKIIMAKIWEVQND